MSSSASSVQKLAVERAAARGTPAAYSTLAAKRALVDIARTRINAGPPLFSKINEACDDVRTSVKSPRAPRGVPAALGPRQSAAKKNHGTTATRRRRRAADPARRRKRWRDGGGKRAVASVRERLPRATRADESPTHKPSTRRSEETYVTRDEDQDKDAFLMYDSRGNASCRYALPWDVILPWFGFSPYSAFSFNATSKPEVTSPMGEKPCLSKNPLSP